MLDEEDLVNPTALQEAVIPALRRGANVVARASSGSGKTLAWTLGILDALGVREEEDEEESVARALILAPTIEAAEWLALAMIPYAQATGHAVAAPGSAWGVGASEADILVTTVGQIMATVRGATVKLDDLESVVVDGADSIAALGQWDEVDSLFDLVPRDAQRVVFSASFAPAINDAIDRRVKRALRYPAEPAIAPRVVAEPTAAINYLIVGDADKPRVLAAQLAAAETGARPPVVFLSTDERAADLAEQLATRGFMVGSFDDPEADIAIVAANTSRADLTDGDGDEIGEPNQTISYDVPADAGTLIARHGGDPDATVIVAPRELPHLREIARQAQLRLDPVAGGAAPATSEAALRAFRDELRAAIAQEDIGAQMLILAPLFEEFPAAEVAAAASALLRSRRPGSTEAPSPEPTTRPEKGRPAETRAPVGPAPVTWARLFVGIGSRDDVRPADLVGTLAGEAGIPGTSIGKIEIRDSFSIVEVQAHVADKVIGAVNGTTIKGRSARVDYDRGGPARRPTARPGGTRRTSRPPPGPGRGD